jgi:hypothetical protein
MIGDRQGRAVRIRALFQFHGGGLTTLDLAKYCRDAGLWSPQERDAMELRAMQAECRKALAADTERGLPFAQPIDGDSDDEDETRIAPRWLQLDLLDEEQLVGLIERKRIATYADYRRLMLLVNYCHARFGRAPRIAPWAG